MLGTTKEKTGADFVTRETLDLHDCESILAEKVDLLFEKRHNIREAALSAINNALNLRYCGVYIDSRQEILTEALQRVFQRAEEVESLLVLKCVSLAAISLGEGRTSFFNNVKDILTQLLNNESHTIPISVRKGAAESLSMACFMSSTTGQHDPTHTQLALQALQQVFHEDNVPPDVHQAAISGWTLLLTTESENTIKQTIFPESIGRLNELLGESDIEVRIAAGKAIALFVEILRNMQKRTMPEFQEVPLDMIESPVPWTEILDNLNNVVLDKSKYRSKADRKRQRSAFRDIIAFIEHSQLPMASIIIRNFQLVQTTWSQIIQMEHVKHQLGQGFMIHMEENPNLMHIFDYYIDITTTPEPPLITKKERRFSLEEAAKATTKIKEAGRRQREQERAVAGYATD